MWRGSASADVRARHLGLQKAFSQNPETQRASFEVFESDVETLRARLCQSKVSARSSNSGTAHDRRAQTLPACLEEAEHYYNSWLDMHPCVLRNIEAVKAQLQGKRLAVFLDYDGTLTPIVSNPDDALLGTQMRDVVRTLAQLFPVAIISGRGREKVENFVQLKELYYAGSHGMDIAGPADGSQQLDMTFQPAAHFRPLIDQVYQELCTRLAGIPGSSVEHNTFCVSAHFRNCPGDCWQDVVAAAEEVVAGNPELRMTRGRKVVEVRPKVNWHKGTALTHLLGVLGLHQAPDVVALYIGDDHTDEDAFKALRESQQGFGILVSTKPKETAARYTVRDPSEVQQFLQQLVAWGSSEHNGWHAQRQPPTQHENCVRQTAAADVPGSEQSKPHLSPALRAHCPTEGVALHSHHCSPVVEATVPSMAQ
ncbi:hypothetical protein QJQ45_018359 [Haematococcus lacustris]|nr:hypothetical protein QJQ45_018359 [Haematococcus lacustris]